MAAMCAFCCWMTWFWLSRRCRSAAMSCCSWASCSSGVWGVVMLSVGSPEVSSERVSGVGLLEWISGVWGLGFLGNRCCSTIRSNRSTRSVGVWRDGLRIASKIRCSSVSESESEAGVYLKARVSTESSRASQAPQYLNQGDDFAEVVGFCGFWQWQWLVWSCGCVGTCSRVCL